MLALLIVVMIGATIAEKCLGTAAFIYGSWWFAALWATMVVIALGYVLRRKMQNRPVLFLLHLSFVVILLGAGITHFWGKQGSLHLRQNRPIIAMETSDHLFEKLPFEVRLRSFEVQNYPDTDIPMDYVSVVEIDGDTIQISMNKIGRKDGYRFYQSSYDPDLRGSVLSVCYDPWGIGVTYVGYALLFFSMALLLILPNEGFCNVLHQLFPSDQHIGRKIIIGISSIVLIAVFSYALYRYSMRSYNDGYLPPVLRSPLLLVHVSIIMIAYVLLLVLFINGLFSLCKKKLSAFSTHLSILLLYPALFLLTAGIFIGAIWANLSWGRYWGWDPKEVWALITLLVYSMAFHKYSLPIFNKPKVFQLYMVLAFLTVLMTYFGVNFLLGGMHSYANS